VVNSPNDIFISVVIPVYRGERSLPSLCERLTAVLSRLGSYEILLIEDRCPERSWAVACELAGKVPGIIAVRLSRNFGQHYAITAGLDFARGEWTVIMDCDLQDQPEEIPRLLDKAREGYEVVLARRAERRDSISKRAGAAIFYRAFALLSGYRLDPTVGSFRLMSKKVVDAYCTMRETARLFGGMVQWLGFETAYVDVEHAARYDGQASSYRFSTLLKLAVDGMISFSNRPLYLSIGLGAAFSVISGLYGLSLVVDFLLHPQIGVPGWLSTITALCFIGGIMLLNLGVLGIYIGRIYEQTKGRPLYVIDSVVGAADKGEKKTAGVN
jgi:glycosyltransferase involved in cell wall biosynthesis